MKETLKRGLAVVIVAQVIVSVATVGIALSSTPASAEIQTVVDDFEDGDITVASGNWSGWSGDTASLTASTSAISGSYSGELTASGAVNSVTADRSSGISAGYMTYSLNVSQSTGSSNDRAYVLANSGADTAIQVAFRMDGTVEVYQNGGYKDTGYTWSSSTDYNIELKQIDYEHATYDLYINGDKVGDYEFRTAVNSIDQAQVGVDTSTSAGNGTLLYDDMEVKGTGPSGNLERLNEDFEDGSATNSPGTGWTKWYDDTGSWSASTSSITDSYSGALSTSSNFKSVSLATSEGDTITPNEMSFKMRASQQSGNSKDFTNLKALNSGSSNQVFAVNLKDGGNITASDGGTEIKIGEWSAGTAYSFTVTEIDYESKTYYVALDGQTYGPFDFQNTNAQSIDKFQFQSRSSEGAISRTSYLDDLEAKGVGEGDLSGRVVSQSGDPVSGVEVQAYAINSSHSDISSSSDPDQAARDALSTYTEAVPDVWDSMLEPKSDIMEGANANYVAVTTKSVTDDGLFTEDDVSNPQIQVPADEKIIFTEWDPTKTGGWAGQNEWDEQLPGSTVDGGSVTIEQISAANDTLSGPTTIQLDETITTGGIAGYGETSMDYAEHRPNPGFYRVYPGSTTETSYVIQVGDIESAARASTQKVIAPNMTDKSGNLASAAKPESDALADGKLKLETTRSGPNGEFTIHVPNNVNVAAVQALGTLEGSQTTEDVSASDVGQLGLEKMNDDTGTNFTQRSYVISTGPEIADVPKSGIELEVIEMSSPPTKGIGDQLNKSDLRDSILENLSYSDLPPALQENLSSVNRSELESIYSQMGNLTQQNQKLEDRVKQLLAEKNGTSSNDTLNETINLHINASNATRGELIERLAALNQGLTELRDTIEDSEGEKTASGDTISWEKPFDTNLDPKSVLVRVHYTNGTTRTLDTSSEYVSIGNSGPSRLTVIGGDTVLIEDLPLGTAAGAAIEIDIATEDGTGGDTEEFENPSYDGDKPSLDAIALSSLRPGPSEQVDATLKPSSSSPFNQVESVEVRHPNGTALSGASVVDRDTVRFTTDGAGVYSIRTTFSTPNDKNHTVVQRVRAGNSSVEMTPGVRVKGSSPFGVHAVVGDGFSGGDVSVKDGGRELSVVATLPEDADTPGEINVHATELSLPKDATVSVRVAKGPNQQTVSKHVETTIHLGSLSDSALVYRNGEPMGDDSKLGTVTRGAGSSTIETHTDDRATLDVRTVENPTITQRVWYRAQTFSPDLSLFSGLGTGAGVSVGVLPIFGLLYARNHRRSQ